MRILPPPPPSLWPQARFGMPWTSGPPVPPDPAQAYQRHVSTIRDAQGLAIRLNHVAGRKFHLFCNPVLEAMDALAGSQPNPRRQPSVLVIQPPLQGPLITGEMILLEGLRLNDDAASRNALSQWIAARPNYYPSQAFTTLATAFMNGTDPDFSRWPDTVALTLSKNGFETKPERLLREWPDFTHCLYEVLLEQEQKSTGR